MKIKFTFPFDNWPVDRQLPNNTFIWGEHEILMNDGCKEADFWFVFDSLNEREKANIEKENTVLITAEPPTFKQYNERFTAQFGKVITCQRELIHPNKTYLHQGHPWFVGRSYDELIERNSLKKTKNISIITSNKQITDGHKLRFDFCHRLKDKFDSEIDLFGRGIRDFEDKSEVIEPYKFSIAIENERLDDWFTEKLYDCYLGLTYPIYYGAPNISKYFNPKSLTNIDINDFDESCRVIETILEDDGFYERNLSHLINAKNRYLKEYNIFPLMINWALSQQAVASNGSSSYAIRPEKNFTQTKTPLMQRIINKLRR